MNRTNLVLIASVVFLFGSESFSEQNEIVQIQQRRLQRINIQLADELILLNDLEVEQGGALQIRQGRIAKSQTERFQLEFERRINELHEICKLTPQQLKKLRVASKGAILKSFEERKKNNANQIDNLINNQFIIDVGGFPSINEPFNQPVWLNTIKKVLDEEQRQLLAEHQKKRNAKRRRANVITYLGQLDNILKLNSDQRSEMLSLLDEKFGKHFESIETDRVFRPINAYLPAQMLKEEEVEQQLKKILSDDQFAVWTVYSKTGLQQQLIFDQAEVAQFPNRPMLGVRLVDDIDGAAIHSVIPNSPADKAGIRAGDIIRSIDDDEVAQLQDVMTAIRKKEVNKKIRLNIVRNGEKMEVEATLVLGKDLQ